MRITIYRGTKEIGGTLIEVKTSQTRLLIDAGFPLFLNGQPIGEDVSKKTPNELLAMGVLPQIKGLYAWDNAEFDAVLVSHAHIDHYGLLKYINPLIPVWMSAGTRAMIEITQRFMICDDFPTAGQTFQMYKPFNIGDILITPYLMDHSAFDSTAFQLTAEGKTIIYTGDFRGHGRKAVCLDRFIKFAAKQADELLIEGSILGRADEPMLTEDDVEQMLVDQCADFTGPILFQCSSQNIDRLVGFYRAAKRLKRTLVIDIYTANVLYELRQLGNNHIPYPSDQYPDIKVFYPKFLTLKIFKKIGAEYAKRFSAQYIHKDNIANSQNRLMMLIRPSMKSDLARCRLQNGRDYYSMWGGYRDSKYQIELERALQIRGFELRALHTSGHASVADIRKVINGLDPKCITPIHTLFPEMFREYSDKTILSQDQLEFEV